MSTWILAAVLLLIAITAIGGRLGADAAEQQAREAGRPAVHQSWLDIVAIAALLVASWFAAQWLLYS